MSLQRYLINSNFAHVSHYTVLAIERALAANGLEGVANPQEFPPERFRRAMSRTGLIRNLYRSGKGPVVFVCMGFSEYRTVPASYWTELAPYCFDCWSVAWPRWEAFFKRQRTRLAFFSARQSAEHFAQVLPQMRSVWLPEAIDPTPYNGIKPLSERRIDVLELGRKHDQFHSRIADEVARAGYVHLFERVRTQIIFPTAAELFQGFGDTKLSICFPSSITHPERSGIVETVTLRYFESFASRCVVLGVCPRELQDLFGYNPVIEVEPGNEAEQIKTILSNIEAYQPLVNRNFDRLLEVGTWTTRIRTMLSHGR